MWIGGVYKYTMKCEFELEEERRRYGALDVYYDDQRQSQQENGQSHSFITSPNITLEHCTNIPK